MPTCVDRMSVSLLLVGKREPSNVKKLTAHFKLEAAYERPR